jgi:GDP-L-fucose synthase
MFKNKKILVAGGTGLVGIQLIKKLNKLGAKVYVTSLDKINAKELKIVKFYRLDLVEVQNCIKVTKGMDIVFNLLGVTGSPDTNIKKPGSFMMANLYCAVNLLYAAQKNNVKKYLYTSTYGVYGPAEILKEKNVWKTFPSEHDKYAGWAKRMGELQVEAYKKEYNFEGLYVVRPANIYGPNMNFNQKNSMVVASLIRKIFNSNNKKVEVWGNGKNIRDFVYSKDVAESMIQVIRKNIEEPINIGSGKGISIKELIKIIQNSKYLKIKPEIIFQSDKPSGDKKRILDTKLAKKYKINNNTSMKEGIDKTIKWYLDNIKNLKKRHSFF